MKQVTLAFVTAMVAGYALFESAAYGSTVISDVSDSSSYVVDSGSPFHSVGAIFGQDAEGGYLCTGTLIHSNWVLTAAHCVDGATNISFGSGLTGPVDGPFTLDGSVAASDWFAHPDWNGQLSKGNDIGLINLPTSVAGMTPLENLFTGSDERGMTGTSVGFGLTGLGSEQGLDNRFIDGNKRINHNDIDVHFRTPGKDDKYFGMDFDSPDETDSSWGSTSPNEEEGGTLFGDSGGPVIVFLPNGEPQVAGVNSFISAPDGIADADFGDRSGHTRVSLYVDWINSMMNPGLGGGDDDGGGNSGGGPPPWAGGGNGKNRLALLDFDDTVALRANGIAVSGSAASVPEPSSAVAALLALGVLAMLSRQRRPVQPS